MAAHASAETRQAARALSFLYEINVRVAASRGTRAVAGEALELCASRLSMKRGAVALLPARGGDLAVLSSRGIAGEDFRRRLEKGTEGLRRALSKGRGAAMVLQSGAVEEVDPHRLPAEGGSRDDISFLCSPVPVRGEEIPFIAVDRLFSDGTAAGDFPLLSAAAAQLAPLFGGPAGGGNGAGANGRGNNSLGSLLQEQITAWIMPMENSKRLRSDVYERFVGEVEKILIGAALEKTGHVQTEAARFLGINRNTLAKKIRRHGLQKKDG